MMMVTTTSMAENQKGTSVASALTASKVQVSPTSLTASHSLQQKPSMDETLKLKGT